jgi:hypothetical protein
MTRKKQKIEITLLFDTEALRDKMNIFFKTYEAQLPLFLRDQLSADKIDADPTMVFKDNTISFLSTNADKGTVIIGRNGEDGLDFIDYKLVPVNVPYLMYENGHIVLFWKRGKVTPDTRSGEYPDFDSASRTLRLQEDPMKILAEAEAKVAEVEAEAKAAEVDAEADTETAIMTVNK